MLLNVKNQVNVKIICSEIDNLGGLAPPEAIILTFLAVAISRLLLWNFSACFNNFSTCSYLIPNKRSDSCGCHTNILKYISHNLPSKNYIFYDSITIYLFFGDV